MNGNIKSPSKREEKVIKLLIFLGICSVVHFLFFFFHPKHPGNTVLYILLSISILYSILKKLYMWYNYANISVPEIPEKTSNPSVDILTTYFPGEPYQMIVTTLEAITKITYPHTAYLCDEANDPFLKKFCQENGIIHVTRNDRKDAKAGNINNALRKAASGDICVVLDPDHIPDPNFLDPIVPFFADPEIGFVQIVQSYYNIKETLVARGAAEQTFQFYGPMMMTLNSYGAVNAIGANCVFRRSALDSIGGHAPGLCEDMHTAMLLYSKGWKAVYLPEVLAKGLAPSNLTTYFQQQLKWARGTFDLLFKVYPKVFSNLTPRQKIHFGILPLHYLSGLMYLINFLIPVLALLFSVTPWEGNIVDFGLALLPLAFSSLLIRAFVQKWVIEKEERGFHITGGLLQINTWWVYILGLLYTLFNKKVPYLPTPKHNEFNTNLKIVIPNMAVAALSIFAIIYGLRRDFTPFSIFMAGFAFFNTLIMLFGIYLTVKVTNQNKILRSNFDRGVVHKLYSFKALLRKVFHAAFTFTRRCALPLLLIALVFGMGFMQHKNLNRWKKVEPAYFEKITGEYLGIFNPSRNDGLVDMEEINAIEARHNLNFDIISLYLAWNRESVENFPKDILNTIAVKNAIPMITWEPWPSGLDVATETLPQDRRILKKIADGHYDQYISDFGDKLAEYNHPVFLRFAHEFDNPQYPWSPEGGNSPADFKAAWRRVHSILKDRGAHQVMLVWNPWKPEGMQQYFPGDDYVDWVGLTMLNYQDLNQGGEEVPFSDLYLPFKEKLHWFTRKPIMVAEFGSLDINGNQEKWISESMLAIENNFPEISALVLFNSAFDNNIPQNNWYQDPYLDWGLDSLQLVSSYFQNPPVFNHSSLPLLTKKFPKVRLKNIKGVRFKKGENWKDNYYVLTREHLLADLRKMKTAGINTIWFKGGNVYEHNILKYTKEEDFKVIYNFDIDLSKGFINNPEYLIKLEEEILEKVGELKEENHIKAYSFNYNFRNYYTKPLLFYQEKAYAEWLHYLLQEIKNIDPSKAIILDLPVGNTTLVKIEQLEKRLPIDAFGLNMSSDYSESKEVIASAKARNIPILLSSVPVPVLQETTGEEINIIVENWQDEWFSNRLSFDGLIDFKGRKKKSYFSVKDRFGVASIMDLPTARILRPAIPLLPGNKETYSAVIFSNGKWISGQEISNDYSFEWKLIKNDIFGNPLALKDLGEGASIKVEIPQDYENYQLLLSVTGKSSSAVLQSKENLNTPVRQMSRY